MKKAILFIAGLMLLLTFAQCKKDKDPEEPSGSTETLPFETVEAIVNDSVAQYLAAADENAPLSETLLSIARQLEEMEEVEKAVVNDYDIRVTFSDGSYQMLLFRLPPSGDGSSKLSSEQMKSTKQGNPSRDTKKALVWEPFNIEFYPDGFSDMIESMNGAGIRTHYLGYNDCTIASLDTIYKYDYVLINTHGVAGGGWMATHEIVTQRKNEEYKVLIENGLVHSGTVHHVFSIVPTHSVYLVSDKFIKAIQGRFNNSIIYAGFCHSMDNDGGPLCAAFFEKGASAFVGFNETLMTTYNDMIGSVFTERLFADRMTVGEAFDWVHDNCPDYPLDNGSVHFDNEFRLNEQSDRNASLFEAPTYPSGAVNSAFTVNDHGGQVCFAHGNLQYQASTGTWRFAPNQYDHIGDNNAYASSYYSGWIDLFCWGTSGWDSGAQEYQPYSGSTDYSSYYTGGSYSTDLTGAYADADWAYHNPISNGGNQARLWRCLTHEEYIYMMENRANASEKYGYACVNGTNGLVILPDRWVLPSGLSFTPQASSWYSNSYSAEQWTQMESAGAVFLPTTGTRQGTSVFYVDGLGDYWSSTANDYETGCSMSFFNGNVYPGDCRYRYLGTSVRPAHDL